MVLVVVLVMVLVETIVRIELRVERGLSVGLMRNRLRQGMASRSSLEACKRYRLGWSSGDRSSSSSSSSWNSRLLIVLRLRLRNPKQRTWHNGRTRGLHLPFLLLASPHVRYTSSFRFHEDTLLPFSSTPCTRWFRRVGQVPQVALDFALATVETRLVGPSEHVLGLLTLGRRDVGQLIVRVQRHTVRVVLNGPLFRLLRTLHHLALVQNDILLLLLVDRVEHVA